MTTDEISQRRNNIAVMELLQRSHTAHADGDADLSQDLMDQANTVRPLTVLALIGAMRIGEVPYPGTPEWAEYLAGQQEALAELESTPDGEP